MRCVVVALRGPDPGSPVRVVCLGCGASLASAGEELLTWYAGYRREVDLFLLGYELQKAGVERGAPPDPDDPYTFESVRRALAGPLEQLARDES